ncbi:MAG: hypothetical protein IB616_00395 [Methanosarcinales archaeon]|nr:MAG: hypothetical protein IB616_00395 [Methanosarcinales archaeon]
MRKINIFDKSIPMIAIIAMVLMVGMAGAITYHYSLIGGTVKVEEPVITTSPQDSYTITMDASSIETKSITITSTLDKTAYITTLPGDETTLKEWGKDLIVYPNNESVTLTAGVGYRVTIFHYASEDLPAGEYHIRVEVSY